MPLSGLVEQCWQELHRTGFGVAVACRIDEGNSFYLLACFGGRTQVAPGKVPLSSFRNVKHQYSRADVCLIVLPSFL